MKLFGTISLILIFLVSTFGVTINTHYCGGHIAESTILINAGCSCGNMEMPSNCCSSETEFVQLDIDYYSSVVESAIDLPDISFLHKDLIEVEIYSNKQTSKYLNYKPPLIELDIPITVQSFLL